MKRDEKKCCGNCKYHKYEKIDLSWVCGNPYSWECANWTEYDDYCEDWEER